MAEIVPAGMVNYRVLLIDPRSRSVCADESVGVYRLIRVAILQQTRVARELQKALREERQIAVLILDILPTEQDTSPCAVAELLDGKLPANLRMIQPDQLLSSELSSRERHSLLAMLNGHSTSLFLSVGWIEEAIRWIEDAMGTRVSSKSDVEQHNAGDGFTLVRFGMEGGTDYWLKATSDPNTHERRVSSLLSRVCRGYVPEIVAERPEWNAWLMCGEGQVPQLTVEAPGFARFLKNAAESLAELQMKTVGAEAELLEAGARDHRAGILRARSDSLFDYIGEAMGVQTSTKVERIEAKRLRELQNIFEDACCYADVLGLPDTVLHGDMNLGNIVLANKRCVFIDWCEAYVGNPLITFEHLLLLNQMEDPSLKASCERGLRDKYRTTLSKISDSQAVETAFAFMPLLAAASTILGPGEWLRTPARNDPRRQAYVRGVARHMDRAAREPELLRTLLGSPGSLGRFHHATCS